MDEESDRRVLGYESPRSAERPNWVVVAIVLTTIVSFLAIVLFGFVAVVSDGPVFPLTVIVAPLWILLELRIIVGDGPIFALLLIGGPALCSMYAAIIVKWGKQRPEAAIAVVLFHVACFLYVCYLRDVRALW